MANEFQKTKSIRLNTLIARLMIQRKREAQTGHSVGMSDPGTPLDAEETQIFGVIQNQFKLKIAEEAGVSASQAEEMFQSAISPYGKKTIVDFYTRQTLIMGVPYLYFAGNAMISLAAFILTSNFMVLFVMPPAIHGAEFFYYSQIKERTHRETVEKILQEGIKL